MYNSITIIGNLGRDPEIKQTSKGGNYAILSVATHRKMAGEKQTEWHKVVVWDEKIADVLAKYTKGGSKVLLQGRLTYNVWEKDGVKQKNLVRLIHLPRFYDSLMKVILCHLKNFEKYPFFSHRPFRTLIKLPQRF